VSYCYFTSTFSPPTVRLTMLTASISSVWHRHCRIRTVRAAQYVHSLTPRFLLTHPQLTTPPGHLLQAYSPTMPCSLPTFLVPNSLPTFAPLLSDSHRVTSFAASPLLVCSPCRWADGGPSVQMTMLGQRRRSACLVVAAVTRRATSRNRRSLPLLKCGGTNKCLNMRD
jgi:hypothetical protein